MPLQGGVQVFSSVGAGLRAQEPRPDEVAQHLLQGLAVLLVDAEKEEGQHQADHQQNRRVVADHASGEDVGGDAHQTARTETDELALGQVERDLGLYPRQIFWDRNEWHS